ncbi:hypothetical protein [Streptococcus ferus]|uniref:hypothetical protein n=1 Tax=Streptococcus ferus TaxID=1345 RepID=UPI00359F7DE6
MKHDHAYSKYFRDDISPEEAYNYFHKKPISDDEFRCDEYCSVPVILVNVRNTPDKWGVPPYFKYKKGYDDKHSSQCPNISKIVKNSGHFKSTKAAQTYKPSEEIIISLSSETPTPYEDVGTQQRTDSKGQAVYSAKINSAIPVIKKRPTHLSKLSSIINRFHMNPNILVNFNGNVAPLKVFFYELRQGQYKLSTAQKIYHGKATIKKVKTKENKELYLLQFEQKCQLDNIYFEKPAFFIRTDFLKENSPQHRKMVQYCEKGIPFHLYLWGEFYVAPNNKIRAKKIDNNDRILLNNIYVENWLE